MSLDIICKDDKVVCVDRDIAIYRSTVIRSALDEDPEAKSIKLDVDSDQMEHVKRYMIHHGKNPTKSPNTPIADNATLDTIYEDKWDAEFFREVSEIEKKENSDPILMELALTADYLGMHTFTNKVAACVAVEMSRTIGTTPKLLAEYLSNLAF